MEEVEVVERIVDGLRIPGRMVGLAPRPWDADAAGESGPPRRRESLESRDAARDTWKLSFWDDYLATIDPDQRPLCTPYVVDNSRHARTNLAEQARQLASRTRAAS